MAKVLIVELIVDEGIEILRKAGHDVDFKLDLDDKALVAAVKTADALIVRSNTDVTAELIKAGEKLTAIGRAGVGVDNIDVSAATAQGIVVVNVPEANILSAAEHTMGLILAQARNIPQAHSDLKNGGWNRTQFIGVELNEKVLGIVGLGRIGQLVARRAQSFEMKVMAYDPYISKELAADMKVELIDLKELMGVADFLTLHVASTPKTKELINADILAAAKQGLRIFNVSRGDVINEDALYEAITKGQVAGAALDVFPEEPPINRKLLELDEVVVTPHLGASTKEAQNKVGVMIAEQINLALAGELPPFSVNLSTLVIPEPLRPFLPLCEILGKFYVSICEDKTQIPEKMSALFQGKVSFLNTEAGVLAMKMGMIQAISDQPITYVNVEEVAKSHGIEIDIKRSEDFKEYVNQVTISGGDLIVSGTITEVGNDPRIVRIGDYNFNIAPSSYMILVENDDQPGMIGQVGTILGTKNVNIINMYVSQHADGRARMVFSIDSIVGDDTLGELEAVEGLNSAKLIQL